MRNIHVVLFGLALSACAQNEQPSQPFEREQHAHAGPDSTAERADPAAPSSKDAPPPAAGTSTPPSAAATSQSPIAAMDPAPTAKDPQAAVSEWRSIGYDYASTYFNRAETKLTKQNASKLQLAWQVNLGSNIYTAPLQVADTIYASGLNDLRALDAASGKERWKLEVKSISTPSFADGVLYLNTLESQVIALDANTGKQLWSQHVDMQTTDAMSSVVAVDDRLLVGAANGTVELAGGKFRGYKGAWRSAKGLIG